MIYRIATTHYSILRSYSRIDAIEHKSRHEQLRGNGDWKILEKSEGDSRS